MRIIGVVYAFDPSRNAVLILGGDKTGNDDFYAEMLPICERIWKQYLAEHALGKHKEE